MAVRLKVWDRAHEKCQETIIAEIRHSVYIVLTLTFQRKTDRYSQQKSEHFSAFFVVHILS